MKAKFLNGSRPASLELILGDDKKRLFNGGIVKLKATKEILGVSTSSNPDYSLAINLRTASLNKKPSSFFRTYNDLIRQEYFDLTLGKKAFNELKEKGYTERTISYTFNNEKREMQVKVSSKPLNNS